MPHQVESLPTLYKTNSNGSTQQWTISIIVNDDDNPADVYIQKVYGQVGGALQTSDPDYIDGKNIGKANETTPLEQARAEATSQWTKKKTGGKGYVESMESAAAGESDALVEGGILPMLAHSFAKQGQKIVYPAFAQPKLDGIRCIATVIDGVCTLWTRTRKPIVSMPHIVSALEEALPNVTVTLDGELYNHSHSNDFEYMVSLIRPDYVKDGASVIEYHIFDCIIPGVDSGYTNRKNFLDELISNISNPIVNVETICVNDETELMEAFEHFVSEGYEGAIVRNASGKYVNKRSYDLQKIKEFQDAEFEIVDVEQGRGKMVGRAIFVCLADPNNDLSRFNVKMEGSLDNLTDIFTNRADYIGKQLTVRYQALTAYGIPRFPIGVSVRDYE